MPLVPFATKSDASPSVIGGSGERLINYYAEPASGVGPITLRGGSGFVPTATLSAGNEVQALGVNNGQLYAACDGLVSRITPFNEARGFAGVVADSPNTRIVGSGSELAVLAGNRYYTAIAGAMVETLTGAVVNPTDLAFGNGFMIVTGAVGNRRDAVQASNSFDAATFNNLSFAIAESSGDALLAVVFSQGTLWLYGERTVEPWYPVGGADFPFAPQIGAVSMVGCLAGNTVAQRDNTRFWVGNDRLVYSAQGAQPQLISTTAIHDILKKHEVDRAFTTLDRGHQIYAIRLKDAPTLCYSIKTGLWSERSTDADHNPWLVTCSTTLGNREWVGTDDGRIGYLSDDVYDDGGRVSVAEATSSPIVQAGRHFPVSRLYAAYDGGNVDIGRTPQVGLETTQDGRNWTAHRWRNLAKIGGHFPEVQWHGLGSFRRAQARLTISDPVPRDLYGVAYE